MADSVKKDDKTEEPKAADTAGELETTTANDGSLAINQDPATTPKAADKPAEVASEPKTETPATSAEDAMVQTPTAAPSTPVVVNDADVAAAEKEADPHTSLAEQIEVLTGEVQALEAKIEKLTNGVGETPSVPTTPEVMPAPAPTASQSMNVPISNDKPAVEATEKKTEAAPTATPAAITPEVITSAPAAATPVNDIYTKILSGPDNSKPTKSEHKDLNDDATLDEGTTGIGTIGEVLIVFGLIALLILGASPFFKSTIGGNWEALKSIGWPTATISLALGFILFLFNKGRLVMKILALILMLVAAVMTATVFDYTSMLGPLSDMLAPIASFYK